MQCEPKIRTGINLPVSLHEMAKAEAKRLHISVSALIAQCLDERLQKR